MITVPAGAFRGAIQHVPERTEVKRDEARIERERRGGIVPLRLHVHALEILGDGQPRLAGREDSARPRAPLDRRAFRIAPKQRAGVIHTHT